MVFQSVYASVLYSMLLLGSIAAISVHGIVILVLGQTAVLLPCRYRNMLPFFILHKNGPTREEDQFFMGNLLFFI